MAKEHQTTLNELIEQKTGEPAPPNILPIHLDSPKRTRTRPGFVSKFVHIPKDKWELIEKYINDHDLDEGKFLTRQLSNIADKLTVTE
jgi:hypothetical protein